MFEKNLSNPILSGARGESLISTHAVLRNTYFLLSLTLLWSAGIAWFALQANLPAPGFILSLVGIIGLYFLTYKLRNSAWGIVSIFGFTGFIGYTMGPFLNAFLHTYVNGGSLIISALGGTGLIFFALSGYVLTTRKDFNFMRGFLFVGLIIAIVAMLLAFFIKIPGLQLAISAALVLLFSGFILYDTSRIINNGERNYILATIALYLDIVNLFQNLLILLGGISGNRN
ncbi:MAG: Bax inhibitor-1/YccA family protein [Gammaproteobacteria bacterium]|nr:Bax inhibitor-1/YccA family protein [Gammaproteobacteria bacterium]